MSRPLTQRTSQLLKRAVSTQISLSEASEALQHVTEEEKANATKEKPIVKSPPKLDREKVRAVRGQIISQDWNFGSEPQHDLLHCWSGQTGGREQAVVRLLPPRRAHHQAPGIVQRPQLHS